VATSRFPVNTSPSNAHQKSNFSKNISGPGTNRTTLGRSVRIHLRLPLHSSGSLFLCRCIATRSEIQFFQKCKLSWNERKHIGEVGDDSFTVHTHQPLKFKWARLGSGGIGKAGSSLIGSRTPESVNTFPWQRLGKHVHVGSVNRFPGQRVCSERTGYKAQ
jgi:hypothetical protein